MFKFFTFIAFYCASCLIQAANLVAGQDYIDLSPSMSSKPNKPTVIEYFSYGCPACFNLEKTLTPWVQAHKTVIDFSRTPVIFHSEWEVYAKAYYTAQELALLPQANEKIFHAIQVARQPLQTNDEMIAFFIKEFKTNPGMTKSAFEHSTVIDLKVKEGMTQAAQLEINQIPAFIVNGRYKTDLGMAKDPKRLIAILDELIKK